MWFDTRELVLTSGGATGGTSLNALDNAMRKALISDFNIIRVTSIVPPGVRIRHLKNRSIIKGLGRMLPAVYAQHESSLVGVRISAGVAIGIPARSDTRSGVIFTASGEYSDRALRQQLKEMVREGMHEMREVSDYRFISAVSSMVVLKPVSCVFASAIFLDEDLVDIVQHAEQTASRRNR